MATPIFEYQYILSTDDLAPPSSYKAIRKKNVHLAFDARFHVVEIRDSSGAELAVVIGFPYDDQTSRFLESGVLVLDSETGNIGTFESTVLPRLSGSFILLTHGSLPNRLYLDPGGSLPIVLLAERQLAAASPALILDDVEYESRFDRDLHDAAINREGIGGWISGDLTAHSGVTRLLPNHFLDLDRWTTHRHWPTVETFRAWTPFDVAVDRASSALARFTTAVAARFSLAMTLTAGNDSRLLLASAKHVASKSEFVTFYHRYAKLDVDVSRELARRFGLPHRVLPVVEANEAQQRRWDHTVGDCVIEGNRATHPTLGSIRATALLTGMYGEVGRCRLYRQDLDAINSARIDSAFVIDRLTLPHHPRTDEAVERWFAKLREQPNSVVLDLAFLELKFGNWAMGQHPIQNTYKFHFLPFAQRAVLESFIGVDPREKTTEKLFSACITKLWPELRELPINKYGDYRDLLTKLSKVARPSRVRRFIRDRFARKA